MESSVMVGVDVSKASFDVAIVIGPGKYRTRAKIANNAKGFEFFIEWIARFCGASPWVVMEATGIYHQKLATALFERGIAVSVVNPARTAAFAKSELSRSKTDRSDAKSITRFAQAQRASLLRWEPEPPAQRELTALVRRLQDLQELRQMERNRLDVAEPKVIPSIEAMMRSIDEQVALTIRAIDDHIDNDPDLKDRRDVLVTIPGISDATAALLLAELGDIRRFSDVHAVVAFAGLNPHLRESGTYKGQARISKIGSARLRAGLYMPAMTAAKWNPTLRVFADRLRANGKAGKVVICAVMRKLLHVVYGVLKSGTPFDAQKGLAAA